MVIKIQTRAYIHQVLRRPLSNLWMNLKAWIRMFRKYLPKRKQITGRSDPIVQERWKGRRVANCRAKRLSIRTVARDALRPFCSLSPSQRHKLFQSIGVHRGQGSIGWYHCPCCTVRLFEWKICVPQLVKRLADSGWRGLRLHISRKSKKPVVHMTL